MNEKRFNCHVKFSAMPNGIMVLDYERHGDEQTVIDDISREKAHRVMDRLNELNDENEQLKSEIEKLSKFENNGEHIRLSINIETGELQRHIYATGQWFGDFDRVLCTNWITEKDYQKFIDRVIEIYNTEFKGDVE